MERIGGYGWRIYDELAKRQGSDLATDGERVLHAAHIPLRVLNS